MGFLPYEFSGIFNPMENILADDYDVAKVFGQLNSPNDSSDGTTATKGEVGRMICIKPFDIAESMSKT